MRGLIRIIAISGFLLFALAGAVARPVPADDHDSIVIVYKGGHRQTLVSTAISRIDLKTPAAIVYKDGHREKVSASIERIEFSPPDAAMMPSRRHFVGKWQVGTGDGGHFFITLDEDGAARKTIGSSHGTWTLVDGQARISWDDGWHDVIRKVGGKHEKAAYAPGKSFDDEPSNVTEARNTAPKPI